MDLTIVANLVVMQSANAVILMAQSGVESTNAEQLARLTKTAVTRVDKAVDAASRTTSQLDGQDRSHKSM